MDMIPRLNPYMKKDYPGALRALDTILSENPGIKYYHYFGHYTFWSLINTDPEKALKFGKEWMAASEEPSWNTITDAVDVGKDYPKGVYEFAAECNKSQLDNYPWSLNFPLTYDRIAALQFRAGNKEKAVDAEQKAIDLARGNAKITAVQLNGFEEKLRKFKE